MNKLTESSQIPPTRPAQALVVVADVRNSRAIAEGSQVQEGLRRLIARVNQEQASSLMVRFSISGGDEIQGLLRDLEEFYNVLNCIDLHASVFSMRFGCGWGSLATPLAERTGEMDGECFRQARRAIARSKQENRWATVCGLSEDAEAALNGVLRLIQTIREGWTDKQRQAVAVRRELSTQTEAARLLGMDTSTLSKMLKAAGYRQLTEIEAAMPALVRHLLKGTS